MRIDSLSYQRAKPKYQKYTQNGCFHVAEFPNKLGDVHFVEDAARTKNLESVWKNKETGIMVKRTI